MSDAIESLGPQPQVPNSYNIISDVVVSRSRPNPPPLERRVVTTVAHTTRVPPRRVHILLRRTGDPKNEVIMTSVPLSIVSPICANSKNDALNKEYAVQALPYLNPCHGGPCTDATAANTSFVVPPLQKSATKP